MNGIDESMLDDNIKQEYQFLAHATEFASLLITKAYLAMENSFCPWSKTRVGAALITKSGNVFSGCNIEVRSRSGSMCAEQSAFAAACTAGDYDAVEVLIIKSNRYGVLPCGSCRQMINHLAPDAVVLVKIPDRQCYKRIPVKDLLPDIDDFADSETYPNF